MDIVQDIVKSILSFSSDAIVIVTAGILFTSYAIFFGKSRIISLILAFYPSALLFDSVPYFKKALSIIPLTFADALTQIVIFLAIFVPVTFTINQFVHTEFSYSRVRKVMSAAALGLTATALTVLFSYHVINLQKIYNFSAGIDSLFIGNNIFWWLLAPFAVLYFFRR